MRVRLRRTRVPTDVIAPELTRPQGRPGYIASPRWLARQLA
jgi:hypothetical protein